MKKALKIINNAIKDGLEDSELQLMHYIKSKIKESNLDFETECQLQEFREIEKDHFDENGKAYKLYISTHLCERMLKLINKLESELI